MTDRDNATMQKSTSIKGAALGAVSALALATAAQADGPLDGVTLTIASMNDQFAFILAEMAPQFTEATGAKLVVDILDYGSLLTKTTADFIGDTGSYDLVTMDIVWAGQYAENGYAVDLTEWIEADKDDLALDDIYPVLMSSIGGYGDQQVAFPLAAYANVLAYRKDLLESAGLDVPTTPEDFTAAAIAITDPDNGVYGFVANGQRGAAGAQDWMQYNSQMGGSIMSPDGTPALNSPENVASLTVYKELFDKAAPPGAANYDWGGREESFRQGISGLMQTWSVGAPGYYDPASSKVVDTVGIALAPHMPGEPSYGVGGWGLSINADISPEQQAAAWEYIKWIVSPEVHKEFNMMGAGSYLRKSELTDPDLLAKYPFLPIIQETFENGDGEYRPRIPQYPEIQDALGAAVNAVLVGDADPQEALDIAQDAALELF